MQHEPSVRKLFNVRVPAPLALGVVLGGVFLTHPNPAISPATAATTPDDEARKRPGEVLALQAEVVRLKGMVPDQSHAMADVAYHYANLWFAGQKQNWPLARFYYDETRSHLNWAVRIIPVRKTHTGEDVDLKAILQAVDTSLLSEVGKAIDSQDRGRFTVAYRQALEGCYSCHKASEKPYLRPQIPEVPTAPIINFNPDATWPQ